MSGTTRAYVAPLFRRVSLNRSLGKAERVLQKLGRDPNNVAHRSDALRRLQKVRDKADRLPRLTSRQTRRYEPLQQPEAHLDTDPLHGVDRRQHDRQRSARVRRPHLEGAQLGAPGSTSQRPQPGAIVATPVVKCQRAVEWTPQPPIRQQV